MTTPNLQVRRATVEDLSKLVPLWKAENLSCPELEKRFKEFQIVESPDGKILAALGFQIAGSEGRLHSEVFAQPEQADALREKLWERAQILAGNHGLVRIWTQLAAPYWHTNGFREVTEEMLTRLPAGFGTNPGPWIFLRLKAEAAQAISIDKEFAMFQEAEKEQTKKIFRQARVLKIIAGVVATLVFVLVIIWAILFFKAQRPQ